MLSPLLILRLLVEFFVFAVDLSLWLILGDKTASPRDGHRSRVERIRVKARNRAIRRWLKKGEKRGPVPDLGLTCRSCDYVLTGLTGNLCPECGTEFDLRSYIDESVDGLRPCGHAIDPEWENVCQVCGDIVPRICPSCGYEIKGLGAQRPCPECGAPYSGDDRDD